MPRYEFKDGKSAKFWEITLKGDSFDVCYGRIGTSGSTSTKVFDSAEKAEKEYNKMVNSKTKKGYEYVGETNGPADSEGNSELEEAIFADPNSVDAWAAYGEFLEEQGDSRGELIALELSGGSDRVKEFYEKNKDEWMGEALVKSFNKLKKYEDSLYGDEGIEALFKLEWKFGFIKSARVASDYEVAYEDGCPSVNELLRLIIKSPAGKFIQELTIGCIDFEGENDYEQSILAISKSGKIPSLRKLFIGDFEMEECEISWSTTGHIDKIYPVFPNLEDLKLHGGGTYLGNLKHDKLKKLTVETGGLPGESLKSIASGSLPEVEEMEIWIGTDDYGGTGNIDMLKPFMTSKNYPKLKKLGLQNCNFENDIAKAISTSEIIKQLTDLDLSMGCMTDEGAQAILDNVNNFKHLSSLNLDENFIGDEMCDKLKQALPGVVNIGSQEAPDEYDGEVYMYVSVGE